MATFSSISVNHRIAGIDEIERVRFKDVDQAITRLFSRPDVSEAMILQTCNRVEVYGYTENEEALKEFARDCDIPAALIDFHFGDGCLRRLLRLGCGLESMIVGEDQILGQIKAAYLHAERMGMAGPALSTAVMKSIHSGIRARKETEINRGSVSTGSAAVELAESILGNLRDRTIMVVGAGEMGTLVANAIAEKDLRAIYVANRNAERAEKLASSLGGVAIRLDRLTDYIPVADLVICATGAPHLIITRKMIEQCVCDKKLLIIDITNPRNVEESIGEIPGVTLHNIDSLKRINEASMARRLEEAVRVEQIVEEELELLKRDLKRRQADSIIGGLYKKTDGIRIAELDRAILRMRTAGQVSESQIGILEDFSEALTNKILSGPTRRLRLAAELSDEDCLRTARDLFELRAEEKDNVSHNKAKAAKTE